MFRAWFRHRPNRPVQGKPFRLEMLEDRTVLSGGVLDPSFGNGGAVFQSLPGKTTDTANASVFQPDGKLVVAGTAGVGLDFVMVLSRYNTDGSLDTNFGTGGRVISQTLTRYTPAAIAISGNKILVSGRSLFPNTSGSFVAQFDNDGKLDSTFGSGGLVRTTTTSTQSADAIALASDGSIYVAANPQTSGSISLVHLDSSGGILGAPRVFNYIAGRPQAVRSLGIDGLGRVVLAGFVTPAGATSQFALGRVSGDLVTVEPSTLTAFPDAGSSSVARDVSIDPTSGVIRLAGTSFFGTTFNAAFAQYTSALMLDTSYNATGLATSNLNTGGGYSVSNFGSVRFAPGGVVDVVGNLAVGDYRVSRFNFATHTALGSVTVDFNGTDTANGLAVASDGSFATVGLTTSVGLGDFAVAAFNADGTKRNSFGTNGQITTGFTVSAAQAGPGLQTGYVAALSGGKSLAAATVSNGALLQANSDIVVSRFNRDGRLDTTYGVDGRAVIDFGSNDQVNAILIDDYGRALIVGATNSLGNFAIARLTRSGNLDTSFNGTGLLQLDAGNLFSEAATGVAIGRDGDIFVVGYTPGLTSSTDVVVFRLSETGVPETDFGTGGMVKVDFGGREFDPRVTLQENGRIVIAATVNSSFGVFRLDKQGNLDEHFGNTNPDLGPVGLATASIGANDSVAAVAIQKDGRIVVAGSTLDGTNPSDFAVVRFTRRGVLDTSFGSAGIQIIDLGGADTASGMVLTDDSQILIAGTTRDPMTNSGKVGLVRLDRHGVLDACFGNGGKVITDLGGDATVASIALTRSGRILLGGTRTQGISSELALLRYFNDNDDDGCWD